MDSTALLVFFVETTRPGSRIGSGRKMPLARLCRLALIRIPSPSVSKILFSFCQLFSTRSRQLVILRLPAGRRQRPLRSNPSVLFHAMKCRIQRSLEVVLCHSLYP